MGGAMDLVACGSRVIVTLEHNNKKTGEKKILKKCTLPLTGQGVADLIISDIAVFSVDKAKARLTLIEKVDDVTVDEIRAKTECEFDVSRPSPPTASKRSSKWCEDRDTWLMRSPLRSLACRHPPSRMPHTNRCITPPALRPVMIVFAASMG